MGHKPLATRFWAKIDAGKADECWIWPGGKLTSGYGIIRDGGRALLAHRVSWEMHKGASIPPTMVVLHACDNPTCVNPNHLSLGTKADNSADMRQKGRQAWGRKLPIAVLDERRVREIRARYDAGETTRSLAADYGVSQTTISQVTSGKCWKMVA